MNNEHGVNLSKLKSYLKKGELKARFNMAVFSEIGRSGQIFTDCGSVGCAVGHGPYAGIKKKPEENWNEYTERVFGFRVLQAISAISSPWSWCFDSNWAEVDNTAFGAAIRIEYFLRNNRVPKFYTECMLQFEEGANEVFASEYAKWRKNYLAILERSGW